MKAIYGGHWDRAPNGWVSIPEGQQDLTSQLNHANESVDVIFTEHVLEHLNLTDGILFLKESYRVLKPTGVIRTVAPFADKLVQYNDDDSKLRRNYVKTQLSHYYPAEQAALNELGIDMLDNGLPFFLNSLLTKHNHKFIWSTKLLSEVLTKIGFKFVNVTTPGKSEFLDESDCLERRIRGLHVDQLREEGVVVPPVWDCESMVVEAMK
jgi:SAM-dependent methyltransferase